MAGLRGGQEEASQWRQRRPQDERRTSDKFMGFLGHMETLRATLRDEHEYFMAFILCIWRRILTPLQACPPPPLLPPPLDPCRRPLSLMLLGNGCRDTSAPPLRWVRSVPRSD